MFSGLKVVLFLIFFSYHFAWSYTSARFSRSVGNPVGVITGGRVGGATIIPSNVGASIRGTVRASLRGDPLPGGGSGGGATAPTTGGLPGVPASTNTSGYVPGSTGSTAGSTIYSGSDFSSSYLADINALQTARYEESAAYTQAQIDYTQEMLTVSQNMGKKMGEIGQLDAFSRACDGLPNLAAQWSAMDRDKERKAKRELRKKEREEARTKASEDTPGFVPYREGHYPLLWEKVRPEGKEWSEYLLGVLRNEIGDKLINAEVKDMDKFCPNYNQLSKDARYNFYGYLMTAFAKFESGFDPKDGMNEKFTKDGGLDRVTGIQVRSEGLFSMSYQDREGWRYPYCEFDWIAD